MVLMAVGAADIAYMAYCLAQGRSHSSTLNVFALAAGFFLYRGSLTAARIVAQGTAFLLGGLLAMLPLLALVVPWDLLAVSARLAPVSWAVAAVGTVAVAVLLEWLRRQLTSVVMSRAHRAGRKEPRRTTAAFVTGMLVCAFAALVVRASLHGTSAREAMERARRRVGPDYRFFVTAMTVTSSRAGTRGTAEVLAYRPSEIKAIRVALGSTEAEDEAEGAPSGGPSRREGPGPATAAEADLAAGVRLEEEGNLSGAIEAYGRAIAGRNDEAEARSRRARAYVKAGDHEKALADTDAAIALEPDRVENYELADWLLARQGQWDEIISRWTRYLDAHPGSGKAFLERGGAYHHKGDAAAARRDIEQACALQHDPACQLLRRMGSPPRP